MFESLTKRQKFITISGITFVGLIIGVTILWGLFRGLFLAHIENYEVGYLFDSRTGEITIIEHTGYVWTPPVVTSVRTVDLRPMQLCISANKRTLNCKLVRFNPEGLKTFVEWHGRKNYSIDSYDEGNLRDIMKSYAFDGAGTTYPFLTIMPSPTYTNTTGGKSKEPVTESPSSAHTQN